MLTLRNPFIMAPVKLGYTNGDGKINEKHLQFYDLRSKHIGAVELEPLYIHKSLRELPTQLGIDADDKIDGLRKVVDLLHENGAKAGAHLNHPGRMANPKLPGNQYVSASAKACENGGPTPTALNKAGIDEAITLVVEAAKRAEKAGFDFVELQMGHGYLVAQFLSPSVNSRTDEYGGSFENRSRFALEMFDAVKKSISIPVVVRLSGDELIENGFHIDEMVQLVSLLKERGVDAVQVLAGTLCNTPPFFFQHMFTPKGKTWELAKQIKEKTQVPTIFVGRINSSKDIETVKTMGADFVAVGRALVADPDFIGKHLGEIHDSIRPCLSCAEGCLGGVRSGKGLQCIVNPFVGTGLEQTTSSLNGKKYAVVGGGIAGMEAALQLAKRQASVDLFEKNTLGGQFNLAWLPPQKSSLKQLIDYYKSVVETFSNITIIKKEATESDVSKGYDTVLLATGSTPAVPPIKGLSNYKWAEVLHDENLPSADKTILIIGGGLIGMEIASKLIDNGNKVIVVEMLEEVARGMEMIEKTMTLKKLKMKGVTIYTQHLVKEIKGTEVVLEDAEHKIKSLDGIDEVVVATGMKSNQSLKNISLPYYFIGDAAKVGNVQSAVFETVSMVSKIE